MKLKRQSPLFPAAVVTFTLLSAREARADVKHVVLSSPAGTEVTERLRAELVLKGFRVSMFGPMPSGCFGDDLGNIAKGADAAVCVDDSVHVFVRKDDKLPHTDTVASVDASDIAAMRAAEIVRVRLELANLPDPPAPPEPPPPPQEIVVHLDAELLREPDRIPFGLEKQGEVRLGASAGILYNGAAEGSPYPMTGVMLLYRPAIVPGLQPFVSAAIVGSKGMDGVQAGVFTTGVRFRIVEDGRFGFYLGPSVGGYAVRQDSTLGSQSSFYSALDGTVEIAVGERTAVAIQASGGFFLDFHRPNFVPLAFTVGLNTAPVL